MEPIVFSDDFGNYYLYSTYKSQIVNIDKKIFDLATMYLKGSRFIPKDYPSYKEVNNGDGDFSIKRFYYLKKNGFFRKDNPYTMAGRIFEEDIDMALSNLKVITFELTQRCNLKCLYCVYRDMYESSAYNKKSDLSFRMAKAVIDYFYKRFENQKAISVHKEISIGFYGGEPLLNFVLLKQIVDYTEFLSPEKFSFNYNMTTNGVLLNRYMDFLVEHNIEILISLDGDSDSSLYRKTQNGVDSFPIVFKNVLLLKNKYPDYFKRNVSFNAVFHNKSDIIKMIPFFKKNFNKVPMISELTTVSLKKDSQNIYRDLYQSLDIAISLNKDKLSPDIHHEINPLLPRTFKFVEDYGGSHYRGYKHLLMGNMKMDHIPTASCIPFANKLFVSADGKFHPCERVGYAYPLGFVDKDGEIQIDVQAILKRYNDYYNKMARKCVKCYRAISCTTCLFQRNLECYPVNKEEMRQYLIKSINEIKKNQHLLNFHMNDIK